VLELLEEGDQGSAVRRLVEDLPLFAAAAQRPPPQKPALKAAPEPPKPAVGPELLQALDSVDPDSLTPREALDVVYRLKRLASGGSGE